MHASPRPAPLPAAAIDSGREHLSALVRLATPLVLSQLATVFMGVVDTLMVARLGTDAMAAVALGHTWLFGTLIFGMGALFGLDPLVSQAHGAGDGARCGLLLQRGLVVALLLSLPIGLGWALTGPALRLAGQDPALTADAHTYALMQLPSLPAMLGFLALRQYLSARTLTRPALWVLWVGNGVNVLFNWVFIFGHLGVPALGLKGAGIATAASRVFLLVALLLLIRVQRLHEGGWDGFQRQALSPAGLAEVLRYGLPVAAHFGLEVWCFQIPTLLAGRLGATAIAAHTIAIRLISVTFNVPMGLSMAASIRVGNLIGAGRARDATRAAWLALLLSAAVMGVAAIALFVMREELPALWRPAADVAAACVAILPIAAAFQIFDGTQAVGGGILRGMGDVRPAALYNLLGFYGLAIPLGYALAFPGGRGLAGLWWGLTAGLAVVAALLVARVARRGPHTARPIQAADSRPAATPTAAPPFDQEKTR